jgi:uncharacterized protein
MSDPSRPPDSLAEYRALRSKVDAFAAAVHTRRAADLACRRGCAGCCHVELTVSSVEAAAIAEHFDTLPEAARTRLRARSAAAAPPAPVTPRCVMLDEQDQCAIYAARPLICRTQGLPLSYPRDLVPAEAVLGRLARRGDATQDERALTCCPLNFTARPPQAADVLDAERVDALLALVNQRYVAGNGQLPLTRWPLAAIIARRAP